MAAGVARYCECPRLQRAFNARFSISLKEDQSLRALSNPYRIKQNAIQQLGFFAPASPSRNN